MNKIFLFFTFKLMVCVFIYIRWQIAGRRMCMRGSEEQKCFSQKLINKIMEKRVKMYFFFINMNESQKSWTVLSSSAE